MNKKISGAKMVLVPIRNLGKNPFPFVEDLKGRFIKYIDFHMAQYLPDTTATGITSYNEGTLYVSLANEIGNKLLFNELPIEDFAYGARLGMRTPICAKLSLQNCYINCQDAAQIGKTAAFIFYYDLPEFSARNNTDYLITDSLSIPIRTATFYNPMPDSERMQGKRFRFLYWNPITTTPDGQSGLNTNWDNVYITLRKGSYNVIENLPLTVLYQMFFVEKLEFANIIFDLQGSYVTLGGAGALASLIGKSVFLNLTYEK